MSTRSSSTFARRAGSLFMALLLFAGCATTPQGRRLPTPPLMQAEEEVPEELLLDVGIVPLDPGHIRAGGRDPDPTSPQIRAAESHFIAFHLKETMQRTAHWGAVRVVPENMETSDLIIRGRIFRSTGERLHVGFMAQDATGRVWLDREYHVEVDGRDYLAAASENREPFQTIYTRFANELARILMTLTPEQRKTIRATAQMRFAAEFAPDAFGDYVVRERQIYRIVRLPADDDPMMERLMRIRDRENMFIDTLDEYYEAFYRRMQPEYENWRRYSQTELEALAQVRRSSMGRIAGGLVLIAAAVALEMAGVENTASLRDVLILSGGMVVIDGVNISQQSDMHRAGIEELSQSFSADVENVVVDFEGRRVELTGTAQEQFEQWREILRELWEEETGFGPGGDAGAAGIL